MRKEEMEVLSLRLKGKMETKLRKDEMMVQKFKFYQKGDFTKRKIFPKVQGGLRDDVEIENMKRTLKKRIRSLSLRLRE